MATELEGTDIRHFLYCKNFYWIVWSRWLTVMTFNCNCSFSHLGHREVGFLCSLIELWQSRIYTNFYQPKQEICEFCGDRNFPTFFPYHLHRLSLGIESPGFAVEHSRNTRGRVSGLASLTSPAPLMKDGQPHSKWLRSPPVWTVGFFKGLLVQ